MPNVPVVTMQSFQQVQRKMLFQLSSSVKVREFFLLAQVEESTGSADFRRSIVYSGAGQTTGLAATVRVVQRSR
jgi:hypothetical protein